MKFFGLLFENCKREPLAAIAVLLTIVLSIIQSRWFESMSKGTVDVVAYYKKSIDERCSLVAFSVDNEMNGTVSDVRVSIITDWIARSGKEEVSVYDRRTGLISAGENTPIPFREVLDVIYSNEGDTLVIPALRPGEYADFFLARTIDSSIKIARQKLHEDKRYINTPRIEVASHVGGLIKVKNIIECPSQDTDLRHYY